MNFSFSHPCGPLGAAFANGSRWSEQRRFLVHALKDVGAAGSTVEDGIKENVQQIVSSLEATAGEPTTPKLTNAIFSSLYQVIFLSPAQLLAKRLLILLPKGVWGIWPNTVLRTVKRVF